MNIHGTWIDIIKEEVVFRKQAQKKILYTLTPRAVCFVLTQEQIFVSASSDKKVFLVVFAVVCIWQTNRCIIIICFALELCCIYCFCAMHIAKLNRFWEKVMHVPWKLCDFSPCDRSRRKVICFDCLL
jgi:hypothetical protein